MILVNDLATRGMQTYRKRSLINHFNEYDIWLPYKWQAIYVIEKMDIFQGIPKELIDEPDNVAEKLSTSGSPCDLRNGSLFHGLKSEKMIFALLTTIRWPKH